MAADWQFMLLSCVRLVVSAAFAPSKSMVINFFFAYDSFGSGVKRKLYWFLIDWPDTVSAGVREQIYPHTHTRSSLKCNHSPNDNHKKNLADLYAM